MKCNIQMTSKAGLAFAEASIPEVGSHKFALVDKERNIPAPETMRTTWVLGIPCSSVLAYAEHVNTYRTTHVTCANTGIRLEMHGGYTGFYRNEGGGVYHSMEVPNPRFAELLCDQNVVEAAKKLKANHPNTFDEMVEWIKDSGDIYVMIANAGEKSAIQPYLASDLFGLLEDRHD